MFSNIPGEIAKLLNDHWHSLGNDAFEITQEEKINLLKKIYQGLLSENTEEKASQFDIEIILALDGVLDLQKRNENTNILASSLPKGFVELTNVWGKIVALPISDIKFIEEATNKLRLRIKDDKLLEILETRKELYAKMRECGNR